MRLKAIENSYAFGLLERVNLKARTEKAYELLSPCRVCPRRCGVDRLRGEKGFCQAGLLPQVASINLHYGEEPPLVGTGGSGTLFFSHCNLRCVFCQNYPISQLGNGREMSVEDLSSAMLRLQDRGAHNINFVTPSPWIPQIIRAVSSSARQGLEIPLVYNTSGYDSLEALNLLDGICDVYLSDYRYHDPRMALRYSQAFDYPQVAKQALREMYRQVGDLEVSAEGVARRGLIVRHLVLPQGISSTVEVLRFLPHLLSPDIHISLMNQYFPAFRASDYPELRHPLSHQEYDRALKILEEVGMINGWVQESYNVSENVLGESCP